MPKEKTNKYQKTFSGKLAISNSNLQKVLLFYLFECPVSGKSVRGKTFEEYGISGNSAFSRLKKELLVSATCSLRKNYKPSVKADLQAEISLMQVIEPPNEYCVFLKYDEKRVMESLFSAIRNAFAHGGFCVRRYDGVRIYYLSNFDGYLKAEMALHEETLLSWIDCVKGFT